MKVIKMWLNVFVLAFLIFPAHLQAQSVKRQSIGTYGTNGASGSTIAGQTIGQSYSTLSFSDKTISLNPGFQQPFTFKKIKGKTLAEMTQIFLAIYPNPASDYFFIEASEPMEKTILRVFDMKSRVVFNTEIGEFNRHRVNCSDWLPGIYFISVKGSHKTTHTKIVITK